MPEKKKKKVAKKTCPQCGSTNVVYNRQSRDLVCNDCGLISPVE